MLSIYYFSKAKQYLFLYLTLFFQYSAFSQQSILTATAPADFTINCSEPLPSSQPTITSSCATSSTSTTLNEYSQGLCPKIIYRQWSVSDKCGNVSKTTQKITIYDNVAPEISNVPADVTVTCKDIPAAVIVTAIDKCDDRIQIFFKDTKEKITCAYSYTLKREYVAIDRCGNKAVKTQYITVKDKTAPTFTEQIPNVTVSCAAIPASKKPTAVDNCSKDFAITINTNTTRSSNGCKDSYFIKRTWTVKDQCNNSATMQQIVTVIDEEKPLFRDFPPNLTIECGNIPDIVAPRAIDNCDDSVDMGIIPTKKNGTCPDSYKLLRTWYATDNCANKAIRTQEIVVKDSKKPVFSVVPINTTVDCASIPILIEPKARDICDKSVTLVFSEAKENIKCDNDYTVVRTWTATDNCSNTATTSQKIVVQDKKVPVFKLVPADATVECGNIPPATQPSVIDACDKNVTITLNEIKIGGICDNNYILVRTWTATDICGNNTKKTQNIVVRDTKSPSLSDTPSLIEVSCSAIPVAPTLTAIDNCSQNVAITFQEVVTQGTCPQNTILKRRWEAKDNCGNTSERYQTLMAQDNSKPELKNIPNDATVNCGVTLATPTNVFATDACDPNVSVIFSEKVNTIPGSCLPITLQTWVATDACGNSVSASRVISKADNFAPVFNNVPRNITIECGEAVPASIAPSAIDICDTNVSISFSEKANATTCGGTVTRIWIATDDCGNSTTTNQIISIIDTKKPIFANFPLSVTIDCNTIPLAVAPTATDNCDTQVMVSLLSEELQNNTNGNSCSNFLLRIWKATDNCGNTNTISQIAYILDSTAPVFANTPAQITVDCSQLSNIPTPIASDNCTTQAMSVTFTESESYSSEDSCLLTINRTWKASDACGNEGSFLQKIIVTDKIAPVPDIMPQDITVSCSDTIPDSPTIIFTDACSPKPVLVAYAELTLSEPIVNPINGKIATAGTYRIERKWTATDACGNPKTVVQNITVSPDDLAAPYLVTEEMEEQITIECSHSQAYDILNAPEYPLAFDACDVDVEVAFIDEKILEHCSGNSYIILRNWIATDDAGNTDEFQQFITLEDNTPPVIYNIPEDIDVICGNPLPSIPNNIFAIDTCAANGQHAHFDVEFLEQEFAGDACDGVGKIIRYWTAVDSCDNAITLEQTITLYPNIGAKIANNKNTNAFGKGIEKNKITREKINKLRIYPNPSSGNTYIDVPSDADKLQIINELGQIIYSVSQVSSGIHLVNMQQWENGIYIIQIQLEGKIQTQKMFLTKENK